MISIETNIPLPPSDVGRRNKYPWKSMEVGDSFLIPSMKRTSVASTAHKAQKPTGFRFTICAVDGGVRVWRIA